MKLSQIVLGAIQLAIVVGMYVFLGSLTPSNSGAGAWLVALAVASMVTAAIYWTSVLARWCWHRLWFGPAKHLPDQLGDLPLIATRRSVRPALRGK